MVVEVIMAQLVAQEASAAEEMVAQKITYLIVAPSTLAVAAVAQVAAVPATELAAQEVPV